MSEPHWLMGTVVPKSDQLNADDLIGGPITVEIEEVIVRESGDQPVEIKIKGYRPYKPCKSMRRVLLAVWPVSQAEFVGRRMTLVNDQSVTWGGKAVGGIRIAALSHLEQPLTMALTTTRGNRKPITIQPIEIPQPSFLDKWRAEFAGAPKEVIDVAKSIATAYTEKDLIYASAKPPVGTSEDWCKKLQAFVEAVKSELSG